MTLPSGKTRASAVDFDVTVPDGMLWVMGDNRYHSLDSLYAPDGGFVSIVDVVGTAFAVIWPTLIWTALATHDAVFARVADVST